MTERYINDNGIRRLVREPANRYLGDRAPEISRAIAAIPEVDEDLQETSADAPVTGSDPDGNSNTLFTPEPNPMSDLYQGTYYAKLYVLNDLKPNENNQVIIAETGNTALNITSVRIEGIVGPNLRTRNSMATNITIKMTEPFGLNLPDRLVASARQLKIKNYLKATFMLQVKLHGYGSTGNYVPVGEGWRWRIMIIDVKSTVTEQGAEHTMTAIPYPELALQDTNGVLPINVTAQGSTVGEVLKSVFDSLNAHILESHGYNFITYKVLDSPYPEGVSETITRPFDHSVDPENLVEENERAIGDNQTTKGHFSQGTDIPSLIDNVFSASRTAVQLATLERSLEAPNTTDTSTQSPTSVMHRVETQVKILGFDPIYGDYQKEITYIVRPYETMRITNPLSAKQDLSTNATSRLQHAMKRMFLCKQYDYIFTGLNTEVEKFDIELNFRWAVSAPLLYQSNTGDNIATTGSPNYDNTTAPRYVSDRDTRELTIQSVNQDINELRTRITEGQQLLDSSPDASAEERAAAETALGELRRREAEFVAARETLNQIRIRNLDNGEDEEELNPEILLAEDLDIELSVAHPRTVLPDSTTQSSVQSGVGMPSRRDNTKSVYGTLLNQLYGSFDGNLQTITLDIKGDPYWLGPNSTPDANFDMLDSDLLSGPSKPSTAEAPNLLNGEHMFAFNFGLPQGYDGDTGSVRLSSDETFSGFYAVSKVENIFEGGRFMQKLEAYRIPGIALNDLNKTTTDEESAPTGDAELNQETSSAPPAIAASQESTRFNPPSIDGSLDGFQEDDI